MLVYVFWLAFSVVARVTVTIFELRISTRIGIDVLHAMRQDVFDHLQRLSMRYFDRTKQGRILARADRDVDSLEHLLTWGPVVLVSMGSSLVLAFARLSFAHAYLAPWVLAALPVLWGLTRIFEKVGFPAYRRIRETHSAISAHVAEHITGVRVVKAFAAEERASARLSTAPARLPRRDPARRVGHGRRTSRASPSRSRSSWSWPWCSAPGAS